MRHNPEHGMEQILRPRTRLHQGDGEHPEGRGEGPEEAGDQD